MLLYGTGTPVGDIRKEVKCSRSSLMNWYQRYHTDGIQGLADGRGGGNNRKLSQEQVDDFAKRLNRYTPMMVLGNSCSTPEGKHWTAKDALRAINVWYGVTYKSRASYYNLLERAGIKLEELQSSSYESFTEI